MADIEEVANEMADATERAEHTKQPQPTIHEPAFWREDLNALAERWEPFRDMEFISRTPEQQAEWDVFLWEVVLHLHDLIQRDALDPPVERAGEAPKPRKRVRVPRAALPTSDDSDAG